MDYSEHSRLEGPSCTLNGIGGALWLRRVFYTDFANVVIFEMTPQERELISPLTLEHPSDIFLIIRWMIGWLISYGGENVIFSV